MFSLLGNLKGKCIYDIACGNGVIARKLSKKGAKEVWASDISPELITIATTKYPKEDVRYLVRDATDFGGIPKIYFDAVVIHQGMFFIQNVELLICNIAQALKPGGVFVFTLLHPLYPDACKAMGDDVDVLAMNKKYLRIYSKVANKKWNNVSVSYLVTKRPLSFYVNLCGKYGLTIDAIHEPKSQKTPIPSSIIMRAVNIS